jgi:hypothetical protein
MKYQNLLVLITMLLITGCAETRKMVVECKFPTEDAPHGPALVAQEYGEMSPIPLNAVQFIDYSLTEQLVVQSLKASRTPTNTVKVNARMVNCGNAPLVVGVRTHFLDKDQMSTEKETAWRNVVIQPHALGQYSESSLTAGVANYLLEIRDAR